MTALLAETRSFLGFQHPFPLILSVLGASLAAIGYVGKKRLERWNEVTNKFFLRSKAFLRRYREEPFASLLFLILACLTTFFLWKHSDFT
jgi:hypothetical protein